MTKQKAIMVFHSNTKVGVDVSSSRFHKLINASPSYANSISIYTVLVLCQLFITKLSVTDWLVCIGTTI